MKYNLKQKAYKSIKDKIMYFELKPGQKIIESKLAVTLNISRTPLREALAMLENEGLIIKDQGQGYTVSMLNEKELEDYFRIRSSLELMCAELFMERKTVADVNALKRHLDKAVRIYTSDNVYEAIESDTKFHDLFYRGAKSHVLYQTLNSISTHTIIMRAAAMQTKSGRDASIADHLKIMEAIESDNLAALKDILYQHLHFAPEHYASLRAFIFDN